MGHVFDEFKRNGISIPFQQVEVRERKDQVVYPVEFDELPDRVEKVRAKKKKTMTYEDLEDMTFTDIAASIKDAAANNKAKQKAKKKAQKEKAKKAKQEAEKEEK